MTGPDERREPRDEHEIEDLQPDEAQTDEVVGGGKVNMQDIHLTKQTDTASPTL